MTDLTKDEIVKMAREAGYRADAKMHDHDYDLFLNFYTLCRAPLVAELEQAKKEVERLKKDLSTVDVILEECKMDWSGDVTQIKAEHAHGLLALQAERDDWKARALKAEQAGAEVERLKKMSVANIMVRIVPGYDGGGEEIYAKSVEEVNAVMSDLSQRLDDVETDRDDWKARAEALERKLPGGKQTDDFESSRIGDYNQGWNDYRKAVKKMFKNINMNSSENSNPDAYLYSLEYGEKVVDTKVSIHQLNYPFGVAGADYLVRNDDGVSYVRQTKLYADLSRALAAGQKFIKENGK